MSDHSQVSLWFRWLGQDLELRLLVQPRSNIDGFAGIHGDRLKLKLKTAPVDGQANRALVRFLAKAFAVTQADIEIKQGQTSRKKTVLVAGPGTIPGAIEISSNTVNKGK